MKLVTLISSLFFLTSGSIAVGQSKFIIGKYTIDSLNEDSYYIKAIDLLKFEDRDSLLKAHEILKRLHYFDSTKYSTESLKNDYSKIEEMSYNYYQTNIIGQWNFEWSGSNWGTSETSASKKAKIVFTNTEAFFYDNDTLVRQTKYLITNEFSPTLFKESFFLLLFVDNKALWNISFKNNGADYIAKLKFNNQNTGLLINEMPNCSCGCPESIYLKNGALDYKIGK